MHCRSCYRSVSYASRFAGNRLERAKPFRPKDQIKGPYQIADSGATYQAVCLQAVRVRAPVRVYPAWQPAKTDTEGRPLPVQPLQQALERLQGAGRR